MRNSFWYILTIFVFAFSCAKDAKDYVAPDIGHSYAGLTLGKYVIYNVDSIFYDDFTATIDTSSYQIKEVVDSEITDLAGDDAFKIIRYRRDSITGSWRVIDVWISKLTQTNFQKTEENIKYIKLIFPVGSNKSWNGNSLNNLGDMQYEYTVVDNAESIGGVSLTSVLTVLQYENINLIEQEMFEEKYAREIGLVYKKSKDLIRQNLSAPWSGYDITMTLDSYGG